MDAILQVVSPDGNVLAENNDFIHLDPRLTFTPAKSGTYIVRLFAFSSTPDTTIRFRGGDNFIYRLTLTTGPFITHAVPLSAPHPAKLEIRKSKFEIEQVEVFGWNIPPKTRLAVVPFGDAKSSDHHEREILSDMRLPTEARLGLAFAPHFAGAARVRLTAYAGAPVTEQEGPNKAMKLAVPASVTGLLRSARQIDTYRVPLKKGEQVVVSVESNSLNSPFDPAAKMTDPAGAVVASAEDVGPNREALFTHVAAKDGEYQLAVSDRFRLGGEHCFYRLTVRREEPDFELSTNETSLVVAPGKAAELPIKVLRRPGRLQGKAGSVGPITFEVLRLPPGVTSSAVVSEPTGPSAAIVTLKLSTNGPAFSGPLRIVGKASEPRALERFVRTPPRLGATFETIWLTVVEKK